MKIAIISLVLKFQAGGIRQILELAHYLKKMGHEVVLYAPEANVGEFSHIQRDLDVRTVPPRGELNWNKRPEGLFEKVKFKLEQRRLHIETQKRIAEEMDDDFDIINAHDYAQHTMYFYKKRNPRVRAVFMMCEPPYMYLPKGGFLADLMSRFYNTLLDIFEKKYLLAVDVVATLAPAEKEWIERRGGRGAIVLSGLDFDKFYVLARRYPGKNTEFRLLAVGIPNPYRRYEDMIYAVDVLRKKGYNVRLDVVANNLWRENEYCNYLKKLIKEKGLEKHIRISFESVSEEELKNLYAQSHIFIHTTYVPPGRNGASWALVVNEAQAAGVPVVLYKNTGAAEVLTDGKNAMLAEAMKADDVAEKIMHLIDNPGLYESIAKAGQKFVKENISWEKYTERMLNLFRATK